MCEWIILKYIYKIQVVWSVGIINKMGLLCWMSNIIELVKILCQSLKLQSLTASLIASHPPT